MMVSPQPVILVTFTIVFFSVVLGDHSLPKCCAKDKIVKINLPYLECVQDKYKRLQIFTENYDFLNKTSEGECQDTDGEDFYIYKISKSKLESQTNYYQTYYPKCCPLGMIYNVEDRSCVTNTNVSEDWINGTLIKIGLPNCLQVITDKTISNLTNLVDEIINRDEGTYCVDQESSNNFVVRECQNTDKICRSSRCLRKCCPDGQSFVGGGKCVDSHVHGFTIRNTNFSNFIENAKDHYEVLYGTRNMPDNCKGVYLLKENKISYSITKDGTWRYYFNYSKSFIEELYDHPRSYCIEHASKGSLSEFSIFECVGKVDPAPKFNYTFWAKILSCILLVATVVIYFIMGEVKNPFGKILMNYCSAMFCLMVVLIVAFNSVYVTSRTECKIRGYAIIFLNSALYTWLNIMSLDIWWTFGSPKRTICHDQRMQELKKMLWYCLYGWGFPTCHVLIIFLFETARVLPDEIQPYIGIYQCYIEARNYAKHIFILLPLFIMQIVNTVLFVKTTIYCIKVKNEIRRMTDTTKKDTSKFMQNKDRLGLILKLAVIMGVVYIFELVSAFFDMTKTKYAYLEVFMDNLICLQGLYIFIIFICKKKTIDFFKNKRYSARERRTSCSTSFSSHVPNSTTMGSIHFKNGSVKQ